MAVHKENQRRHPRLGVRQRVWCEGENLSLYVQALNMSRGGAFIQSGSWASRDQFELSFSFEDEPIVMDVKVVWERRQSTPPGIGVEIVHFKVGEGIYDKFLERLGEP